MRIKHRKFKTRTNGLVVCILQTLLGYHGYMAANKFESIGLGASEQYVGPVAGTFRDCLLLLQSYKLQEEESEAEQQRQNKDFK